MHGGRIEWVWNVRMSLYGAITKVKGRSSLLPSDSCAAPGCSLEGANQTTRRSWYYSKAQLLTLFLELMCKIPIQENAQTLWITISNQAPRQESAG